MCCKHWSNRLYPHHISSVTYKWKNYSERIFCGQKLNSRWFSFFRISHNLWKENTPILELTFSILVQLSAPLDLAANIKVLKLLLSKNCKYLLTNTLWRVNLIFRKFVNYCIFNWVTLTFSFWVIVLRVIYTVVYLFMTY